MHTPFPTLNMYAIWPRGVYFGNWINSAPLSRFEFLLSTLNVDIHRVESVKLVALSI